MRSGTKAEILITECRLSCLTTFAEGAPWVAHTTTVRPSVSQAGIVNSQLRCRLMEKRGACSLPREGERGASCCPDGELQRVPLHHLHLSAAVRALASRVVAHRIACCIVNQAPS